MRIFLGTCSAALLLAACSDSGASNQGTGASGGTGAVAGTSTTGGSSGTGAAGATGASGGASGAGGTLATGGSGGASATTGGGAGASGSAGVPATGGMAATGGSVSTGGMGGSAGQSGSAGVGVGGAAGIGQAGGPAGNAGAAGEPFVPPPLVTSADNAYWDTSGTVTETTSGTADVTVNDTAAQTWQGFGGSFNEMGWTYLSLLSDADRAKALALLFGRDGLNLAWGRIPMGASDYATDRYSLDEVAAGEVDTMMTSFTLTRDGQKLIPFVKAAQAVKGDLRFWASPWSPPTWMKTGPFNDDSPFDGGTMKGDDATLGALALYFVKFVQGYQAQGINVELVSPQNEPGYSGTYPTCAWAPADYATFVGQHLAPQLTKAGLTTKIMLGTFNGGTGDTSIVSTVMGDTTASADIWALGYQWGMQSNVKADQKYNLPIWQTEHKCGNYPWATPFNDMVAPNDHAYAVESWGLFRDWIKSGVTAYSVWNLVLDTVGNGIDSARVWPQNALLTVDTSKQTLNVTPTYYVYRHFTEFVEPGATVLGTTGGDAVAFKNPGGSIVTVMYNSGAAKTYTVAVGGKKLQFPMPSGGWATVTE